MAVKLPNPKNAGGGYCFIGVACHSGEPDAGGADSKGGRSGRSQQWRGGAVRLYIEGVGSHPRRMRRAKPYPDGVREWKNASNIFNAFFA